jgi:hypothetical protein
VTENEDRNASILGQKVSRRKALSIAGVFGAGVALGGGGALSARALPEREQEGEFYDKHQAGIATRSRTGCTSPPSTLPPRTRETSGS